MTERSRMGVGMTAVKRMAAVAMMAGLLAGPVAAPNRRRILVMGLTRGTDSWTGSGTGGRCAGDQGAPANDGETRSGE
jgi:hypothetical protein